MAKARRARAKRTSGQVAGIGTDIVEVARVHKSLARTPGFARLAFSDGERAYCDGCAHPAEHYAARFAAKEAFLKAVGKGILQGVVLREIEVVRDEGGEPSLRLGKSAARAMAQRGGASALVSLSHAAGWAVAFVVVQR
jgi:holo-[acyl-carrier protein] synthase